MDMRYAQEIDVFLMLPYNALRPVCNKPVECWNSVVAVVFLTRADPAVERDKWLEKKSF